jgi:hypothetical protein
MIPEMMNHLNLGRQARRGRVASICARIPTAGDGPADLRAHPALLASAQAFMLGPNADDEMFVEHLGHIIETADLQEPATPGPFAGRTAHDRVRVHE